MDYRFNATEWATLSALDRARRCRLMAEEAKKLADKTSGLMQEGYLEIAINWLKLADEIGRSENGRN